MVKRNKPSFAVLALVLTAVIVLSIPPFRLLFLKRILLPVFHLPLTLVHSVSGLKNNVPNLFFMLRDYNSLKEELDRLKFELNRTEEFRLENERLLKLLELNKIDAPEFTAARVIGKEPSNWLGSLIINRGRKHGLEINQPVMTYSGIIGKIIEVTPRSAKVLLISDVNSRVVVLVQRSRVDGILEGIGKGVCRLKYLPLESDVQLGDRVVTAGMGGVYPKGLVIGTIESIRVERGGIYKSCIVKPTADFKGLEEVLCINSGSVPSASP